ncbi:hypothetical protein ASG93_23590 [Paenibacillus sp. Soil787]|nr:hypothetical protein ASG93_23590 [Paenibacillus sp. Soil787]
MGYIHLCVNYKGKLEMEEDFLGCSFLIMATMKRTYQTGETHMELKPVFPFEPISTETIPASDDWVAQIKWDGVRMLTYFDGNDVRLVNRRCNDRTKQYPELLAIKTYCSASSVILDGS